MAAIAREPPRIDFVRLPTPLDSQRRNRHEKSLVAAARGRRRARARGGGTKHHRLQHRRHRRRRALAKGHADVQTVATRRPELREPRDHRQGALGKLLYYDHRLSQEGTISCDSCHVLARFGVDNLATSPGDKGQPGGRNSPTVFNAALHMAQFWDGRAKDVEQQAVMPVLNPVEMAIPSESFLLDRLAQYPDYRELFAKAFPDDATPMSYANIGKALAAFERTLLTPSRFDRYLEGDRGVLDPQEKAGLRTFFDMGCTSCHNGVTIGAQSFRKFGLGESYWVHTGSKKIDTGRFQTTGDEADKYVFKVASLRNVEKTFPYFHDGSVTTLEDAVRVMGKLQVGMDFDDQQVADLSAFLRTLTGTLPAEAIRPPEVLPTAD
ncbi:MAG: c-type cytochrome [Thermoanaerobaculia bacterium]|nr:c-type cytochrome [Thermoanaerobaculia bacterium]